MTSTAKFEQECSPASALSSTGKGRKCEPSWEGQLYLSCGGITFSARAQRSSAEVRRVLIHDIKEVEGVGQQEQQGDKRYDEKGDEVNGEVEEIRSNAHRTHETWR